MNTTTAALAVSINETYVKAFGFSASITDIKVLPGNVAGEQMLITFKNGYKLSILNGQDRGLYTSDGTYEVAILTPEGKIDGDVFGYQTLEEIGKLATETALRS